MATYKRYVSVFKVTCVQKLDSLQSSLRCIYSERKQHPFESFWSILKNFKCAVSIKWGKIFHFTFAQLLIHS